MRRLAVLLVVSLVLAAAPAFADPTGPDGRVSYRPPVDGPIVDAFRPPPELWNAGNRGIDYAPARGTPVRAAADGEVVFAGQVGGDLHVVVLHADGIRTSYSFLQSIAVRRGEKVRQGQAVGASAEHLHFGARAGDTYIDPESLFDRGPAQVFLVPDEERRPATEAKERSALAKFLGGVGRAVRSVADSGGAVGETAMRWAGDAGAEMVEAGGSAITSGVGGQLEQLRGLLHYSKERNPFTHVVRLGRTTYDWWRQRVDCTPANVRAPPLPERRVAVLLSGLGSSSGRDSIDELDTAALGYAGNDVKRFSYNGGVTTEQPYSPADTTVDIRTSAERLRELLKRVHRENPGVPVDLIGHSQGGVVARTFLAYEYDANDPDLPKVASMVTLGSPHQGADIATALAMTGHTSAGDIAQWAASASGLANVDLRGESVRQLSETSTFLAKLSDRSLPEGVNVKSIGARGDAIVAANHTALAGAQNIVVSVPGAFADHRKLPGSEAAQREVALAVAGLPPTCQNLGDMLLDTAVSDVISTAEDFAGAAAWVAARRVDDGLSTATKPPTLPPPHRRKDP